MRSPGWWKDVLLGCAYGLAIFAIGLIGAIIATIWLAYHTG
jgi:hypothetical protein